MRILANVLFTFSMLARHKMRNFFMVIVVYFINFKLKKGNGKKMYISSWHAFGWGKGLGFYIEPVTKATS